MEISRGDILGLHTPLRAEWLDAHFLKHDNKFYLLYCKTLDGRRVGVCEPLHPNTLMEDRRIDLAYWVENPTPQGLPTKDTPNGSLYYRYPRTDCVAGFSVTNGGAGLICVWDSIYLHSGLGVYAQRQL